MNQSSETQTQSPDHLSDFELNEYLDAMLDPDAIGRVAAHLTGCSSCAARLSELRALFASLDELPDLPLERDLAPGVLAAIAPSASTSPILRLAVAFQLAIAVGLILLAWPVIARGTLVRAWLPSNEQVTVVFANTSRLLVEEWGNLQSVWQSLVAQGMHLIPHMPTLSLPRMAIWQLLAAAGVLWLVGNGLLLRRIQANGHASRNGAR